MKTSVEQIIFENTADIIERQEVEAMLSGGKKLRVYHGIDPTSPNIHLGHTLALRKLKQFQRLGHKVIFLIGDFTATIGDPTGKTKMREVLTGEQVKKNAADYIAQAKKIIDIDNAKNPVEVVFNSQWHAKENKKDLLLHLTHLTVGQLIERDMFQERIKNNQPISVAEFLYPYLQGYDAVALNADIQLGGTDQTFNMLMGRDMRKKLQNKSHCIITWPLIEGTDGRKMSKTYNNAINLSDSPQDMFGKVMSINDSLTEKYLTYFTDTTDEVKQKIKKDIEDKKYKEAKLELAYIITKEFHGEKVAKDAKEYFAKVFSRGEIPDDIIQVKLSKPRLLTEIITENNLVASKSEARRVVEQKGVSFNREVIDSLNFVVDRSGVVQVGKRQFLKINF